MPLPDLNCGLLEPKAGVLPMTYVDTYFIDLPGNIQKRLKKCGSINVEVVDLETRLKVVRLWTRRRHFKIADQVLNF